ncbi:class I SAM-dependent methyltransferase [Jatrophihabitans fulvus]
MAESFKRRALVRARLAVQATGFDVVREDFKHRFVPTLEHHRIETVVDIGANTGQFGHALRRANWPGRIVSVEPLRSAFDELRAAAAGDQDWSVERVAISDRPGTITMNVAGNSVSSSVLPMLERHTEAAPQTAYVATEEVEATTVDALVEKHGIDLARTLLKVDVQGFERAVLAGATATLPHVAGVRSELSLVPLYDGQALMDEVVSLLGGHGLDLWLIEPGFSDPRTRRLLQADGTFYRGE